MIRLLTLLFCATLLGACAKEPPPRSVLQFIDNPLLLEAAMVRCAEDRAQSKYDAECVNARQAAVSIQAKEEAKREDELEARSEAKLRAKRQVQDAADEAQRRALEAEDRLKDEDYISQFGEPPPPDADGQDPIVNGNVPIAVIPDAEQSQPDSEEGTD